jgi:hypothetical protein
MVQDLLGPGIGAMRLLAVLVAFLSFAYAGRAAAVTTVSVSTAAELTAAVSAANARGGNTRILLGDGAYRLDDTLYVNAPGIAIEGASGDRAGVVIQGDSMSESARVKTLVRVAAKDFSITSVTLWRSGWHLLQVVGETDADGVAVRNVVFRDSYQQMVKVSIDSTRPQVTGDNGLVEDSVFEYTAGIGPQFYVGGIDAHGAKNWIVRRNVFRDIASPAGSIAEHAVHFWNGSADNIVDANVFIDCDRAIGFGLGGRANSRGVISNNFVYHSANGDPFADVGIGLADSPSTRVLHNTVFLEHDFPWAVEYRFSATSGVEIANNLTNRSIAPRDGATGTLRGNVVNASRSWFRSLTVGDLHLTAAAGPALDTALSVAGAEFDIDGDSRAGRPDVGADEVTQTRPSPPANLRAE